MGQGAVYGQMTPRKMESEEPLRVTEEQLQQVAQTLEGIQKRINTIEKENTQKYYKGNFKGSRGERSFQMPQSRGKGQNRAQRDKQYKGNCWVCGKLGHMARDCWHRKTRENQEVERKRGDDQRNRQLRWMRRGSDTGFKDTDDRTGNKGSIQ